MACVLGFMVSRKRTAIELRPGDSSAAMESHQTEASAAKMNGTLWRELHLNGLAAVRDCRRRMRHCRSNLFRQLSLIATREA